MLDEKVPTAQAETAPKRVPALLTVWPQAGKIAGVSRGTAFRCADRGDWPCHRSGKRMWVITARFEAMLGRPITPADLV